MTKVREYEISKGMQTLALALAEQRNRIVSGAQEELKKNDEAGDRLIAMVIDEVGAPPGEDYRFQSLPNGTIVLIEVPEPEGDAEPPSGDE
jgi:hypothetical protein